MTQGNVSVLIPVYNEEKTVGLVIQKVLSLGGLVKEVVVVDDGSSDGTAAVVEAMTSREPRLRFERLDRNRGKTAAVRHALSLASGEIIIVQDADLEYDPAEIPEVVGPILSGDADVVYGSRFLVRRASRVIYFYHYLANKSLTFMCNLFTNRNMSDIETGYKAFRSCVIRPLRLTSSGFGMEIEITVMVCKTKARTYEVPISYYGRSYEDGKKVGFKDGVMAGLYILFYSLIKPLTAEGRRYVRSVNEHLHTKTSI